MVRVVVRLAIVSSLLVLALALSAGESTAAPVKIYIGGGATVPVNEAEDAFEGGFNLRAHVQTEVIGPLFAVRGTLGYDQLDLQFEEGTGSSGDATFGSALGGMTIGPWLGPVRPYAGLDVGAVVVKVEEQLASGGTISGDDVLLGIDGALGAEVKLGAIGLFVEAKILDIMTEEGFNPASFQLEDTQLVPVTFGIRVL